MRTGQRNLHKKLPKGYCTGCDPYINRHGKECHRCKKYATRIKRKYVKDNIKD